MSDCDAEEKTEQLEALTKKVHELGSTMRALNFRMKRTKKNIRLCKETCTLTNQLIGNLHVSNSHEVK